MWSEDMIETSIRHRPVLLRETVELLAPRAGGLYVDGTVGEGGHAEAILEACAPDGCVIGLDRDPSAIAAATARLARFGDRFTAIHARFGEMDQVVAGPVDGLVLDLGVRSPQFDEGDRGFSLIHDGPVDMRMDPSAGETAAELLDRLDLDELTRILGEYGEEPRARRIATAMLAGRPWTSTLALADCVARASGYHGSRVHPATRAFQALRIAVNDELGQLEAGLDAALDLVRPGGRVVIISFHSLEDRIVKRRFRSWAGEDAPRDAYGHPVTAPRARHLARGGIDGRSADASNPRARSARVRAVEILPAESRKPASRQ